MAYEFADVVDHALAEMKGQGKRRPSTEELNSYFTGSGSVYRGYDKTVSWCGVFAAYILRKASVGIYWKMAKGLQIEATSDVTLVQGCEGIGVGDVAVALNPREDANGNLLCSAHHFIVVRTPASAEGLVEAVHGNNGGTSAPELFHGLHPKYPVNKIVYYYRVP
jgi:hypothetical protein